MTTPVPCACVCPLTPPPNDNLSIDIFTICSVVEWYFQPICNLGKRTAASPQAHPCTCSLYRRLPSRQPVYDSLSISHAEVRGRTDQDVWQSVLCRIRPFTRLLTVPSRRGFPRLSVVHHTRWHLHATPGITPHYKRRHVPASNPGIHLPRISSSKCLVLAR